MTHQPDEKFDWNRVGLDGKPRELHVAQSLASIDFSDFEPALIGQKFSGDSKTKTCPLVRNPLFNVEIWKMNADASRLLKAKTAQIIAVVSGLLEIKGSSTSVKLAPGQFCVVPACLEQTDVSAMAQTILLRVEAG